MLWSSKISPDHHPHIDAHQFDILKRNVKIAVLICNLVQTLCLIALIYFVIDGTPMRRDAKEWTFEMPSSKVIYTTF